MSTSFPAANWVRTIELIDGALAEDDDPPVHVPARVRINGIDSNLPVLGVTVEAQPLDGTRVTLVVPSDCADGTDLAHARIDGRRVVVPRDVEEWPQSDGEAGPLTAATIYVAEVAFTRAAR